MFYLRQISAVSAILYYVWLLGSERAVLAYFRIGLSEDYTGKLRKAL
jgi:hypothetical protein